MADAESSSITDSSLAPSTTPTSILDSLPPHSSDRTASTDKVDRRASLGLIDAARVRFSKDSISHILSLILVRVHVAVQTEDPENEHPLYPNYVKLASHTVDLHLQTMDDSPDERPGRGFGARIVNFLNRSRSRSRSKKRRSRSLDAFPADPMPTSTAHLHSASLRLHARHSSLETDQDALVAGPSRPITRSPSRPLSGTAVPASTSAKPRARRVPDQIAVHNAAPTATAELVAQVVPVEQTKSSSSRKGKTFNIFNILLSSPKKGSFSESTRGRSRPSTPTAAAAAPPPPPDQQLWHGSDNRAWEVKSGSNRSQKSTRKGLAVDMEEDRDAQFLPCKSADGRSAAVPGLIVPQPRRAPIHVLNSPPPMHRSGYSKSGRVHDREYEEDDRDAQASVMEGRCSPLCGFGGSPSKGSHASQEKGKEKEKERMRGARERIGFRMTLVLTLSFGVFVDVHRFDANAIPLDGPYGLLAHIERLLDDAPGVDQRRKRVLLDRLLRVVQDSENR
ncbi:hypothetical protein FKP32DRAFT_1670301 [Trametes sanguinea]|nr:hypothetical protein FKP32DRAFT_1670301 [Trametes sanguinea]